MAVPEGWIARESIELASPEQQGYVFVSADLLPKALTADEYAEGYGKQMRERLSGYEELESENVELAGGQPAIVRSFRWTPPEGAPIAELHLYAVRDRRGILARASCAEERFTENEPRLREVLLGIDLGTPPSRTGVFRSDDSPQSRTFGAFEAGQLTTTRAEAFGLAPSNGDSDGDAMTAWGEARDSWQKGRAAR